MALTSDQSGRGCIYQKTAGNFQVRQRIDLLLDTYSTLGVTRVVCSQFSVMAEEEVVISDTGSTAIKGCALF